MMHLWDSIGENQKEQGWSEIHRMRLFLYNTTRDRPQERNPD